MSCEVALQRLYCKKRYKHYLEFSWNMDKFWDYIYLELIKTVNIYKIIYLLLFC